MDVRGLSRVASAGMADTLGQRACPLAGDLNEVIVDANLFQERQSVSRFGEFTLVKGVFELEQGVVDAKPVVFHAALEQFDQLLLAREPFADLQELCS